MTRLALADELSEIRAEIARLKLREAQLRAAALKAPDTALTGRWSRIEVALQHRRVFDPALLPEDIRTDPQYWRDSPRLAVHCLAVPQPAPRPGWPIRRDHAGAGLH